MPCSVNSSWITDEARDEQSLRSETRFNLWIQIYGSKHLLKIWEFQYILPFAFCRTLVVCCRQDQGCLLRTLCHPLQRAGGWSTEQDNHELRDRSPGDNFIAFFSSLNVNSPFPSHLGVLRSVCLKVQQPFRKCNCVLNPTGCNWAPIFGDPSIGLELCKILHLQHLAQCHVHRTQ